MRLSIGVAAVLGFFLIGCDQQRTKADKERTKAAIEDCKAVGGVPRTETKLGANEKGKPEYYTSYNGCDFPPQKPLVVNPEAK